LLTIALTGTTPGNHYELAAETGAGSVFCNEIAQAPHQAIVREVEAVLARHGIGSQKFPGDLLTAPANIRNKEGRGLRVFTPFWRRVQMLGDPPKPLPAPRKLSGAPNLATDTPESWHLEPTRPDWAAGLRDTWNPGEASAQARLAAFLENGVAGYAGERDRPDRNGTSNLSPHLRFGEISPRQIWHAARFAAAEHPPLSGDIDKFLSELGWREFCLLQGQKFDPDGVNVRRWVPELALPPAGLIHQPSTATPLELAGAGVELGNTYPIADHKTARERALAPYAGIRDASMTSV
jgi:deoxyribodipyrimidine photo-lyase